MKKIRYNIIKYVNKIQKYERRKYKCHPQIKNDIL